MPVKATESPEPQPQEMVVLLHGLGRTNRTFPLGVITGNRSLNPLSSWIVPGADDGKVAVERTKVEGMTDFLVVPYGHTFIMSHKTVAEQTAYFLRTGHFRRTTHAER